MKKNKNFALSISAILPKVLKPVTKKFTSKLFEIKFFWDEILGEDMSKICIPTKFSTVNKKNVLEISVNSNNALEISYFSCKIKDKINNFFKNDYIDSIKLKKCTNK